MLYLDSCSCSGFVGAARPRYPIVIDTVGSRIPNRIEVLLTFSEALYVAWADEVGSEVDPTVRRWIYPAQALTSSPDPGVGVSALDITSSVYFMRKR